MLQSCILLLAAFSTSFAPLFCPVGTGVLYATKALHELMARSLAKSVCAASGSHCFQGSTDLFWGKVLSLVEEFKKKKVC